MVLTKDVKNKSKKSKKGNSITNNDFPPGMAPKMLNMLKLIEELEEDLSPLINKPHHDVLEKLSPLEKSKIGMLEAYTINSLFWVLMKTSKEVVEPSLIDDYKIEMGRLKEMQNRIAEVEARSDRPQVNTRVASRFIRRGIGMSSRTEEKQNRRHKKLKTENEGPEPENGEKDEFKNSWQ